MINIDKINAKIRSLEWLDFAFSEINVFHPEEDESQVRLICGIDIDMQSNETFYIVFHDVSYISAQLMLRYSADMEQDFVQKIKKDIAKEIMGYELDEDESLYKISVEDAEYIYISAKNVSCVCKQQ